MGLIETMRSGCASTARRPLPTSSDRKTPDAWKIPAHRAEYYLTKNGVPPFPAEPGQSDFVGSVRCDAVGEGLFSAVALEMDPGTRIFTTLPVVPLAERMSQG